MGVGDLVSDATYDPPVCLFVVTGRTEGDKLRVQEMSSLGGGRDVYIVREADLRVIQRATHHLPVSSPAASSPVRG